MTITATAAPVFTIENFLFGTTRGGPTPLLDRLREPGPAAILERGLPALSPIGRQTVAESVATVARGLTTVDLADVIVAAWRAYQPVVDTARASAADPRAEKVIDLLTHRITYAQRPTVDVLLDGQPFHRIGFELMLVFQLTSVAAVLRAGRLIGLRSGRSELVATLAVEGVAVAQRNAEIDPSRLIRLGNGIPLI